MRVFIIADDLTGAADCASPFRQAGLSTAVVTTPHACHAAARRFEVVSFTLHTRDATAAGVRKIWGHCAPTIADLAQTTLVYQKIDSTLRGHPSLEVRLLLDLLDVPAAVIIPAFPKQGRQTIDGVHRVQGIPITETEYAHTGPHPLTSPHLPERFTHAGEPLPVHLASAVIDRGAKLVATWLRERLAEQCRLITADAANERHLDTLTRAVLSIHRRLLLVGSAGWAERLALASVGKWVNGDMGTCVAPINPFPHVPMNPARGQDGVRPGVLGVVGSLSSMATRQVEYALEAGVTVVPFHRTVHDPAHRPTSAEWQSLAKMVAAGQHSLVWTNPGERHPTSRPEGKRILRALGGLVRAILAATAVSGIVIVGGDTARAIFRALRASGWTIDGQIAAGIPYGRLLDGPFAGLPVVTKAGGFGEAATLRDCLDFLQHRVPWPKTT